MRSAKPENPRAPAPAAISADMRRKAVVFRRGADDRLGDLRADARQELGDAKAGDPVARIFGEAHQRERVLHMRGVEEFEAAELDEGDVAPRQLQFERGAVMGGAKQHRLRFERSARLAVGERRGSRRYRA